MLDTCEEGSLDQGTLWEWQGLEEALLGQDSRLEDAWLGEGCPQLEGCQLEG